MNSANKPAPVIVNAPGFNIPDPQDLPSRKNKVTPEEWQARCNLAAVYRLVALHGWTDLVFTHISLRLPDEIGEDGQPQERFLINPYGVFFEEMTASALVKISIEGQIKDETPYFINPAGFTVHSAVHSAREDAGCVIHVHTPYGIAVSVQKQGLRAYTQFAMQILNDISYHAYEGIALDLEERARLIEDLGANNIMILRNHGTLTIGANPAIAFLRMYFLENACKTQILAQAVGGEAHLHEEDATMSAHVAQQGSPAFIPGMGDNLVWPGLLRKLHRANPHWDC